MMLKLVFVILMALGAFGDSGTPGTDEYLLQSLSETLNPLLFDGPKYISNAPTNPSKNKLPTLEQMMYYIYYSASTYSVNATLSCEYCLKYEPDVFRYQVINNRNQGTLAIVTLSKTRKEIVVAFRGTANIWNVIQDLLLISARNSNTPKRIKVHQGFYIATMSLYNAVVRRVSSYLAMAPGSKVVLTGHSAGGAMARITYLLLAYSKRFPVAYELYTYGEPRVGNKHFADFMNSQSITSARIVNRRDIVPHVPPTSVLFLPILGDYYVHPQTEFWINGETDEKFCNQNFYEDPQCSMSTGPFYSAKDHLLYFDVNLQSGNGLPLIFEYLPLDLLNPVNNLPPLPTSNQNSSDGILSRILSIIG